MGKPAARIGDMHDCPAVSPAGVLHVGGPIVGPGSTTVYIEGLPAATAGDACFCVGEPDKIVSGSTGVFIEGKAAVRQGDRCAHGGVVVGGSGTVEIGERMGALGVPGFGNVDDNFIEPSEEQKKVIINQAIKDCVSLLERKLELLQDEDPNTLSQFKDWFGSDDHESKQKILSRISRALAVSKNLTEANFAPIKNEKAKKEDYANAYHEDESHKILLGDLFWKADAKGKCSQASVIVHELSHFDDIGPTEDVIYGEERCLKLAKDYPHLALSNADSFEFFIIA
ncbi:M35 family metallo-endopeptidase [Niastella vici]|uniref:M35 family metallo-endopeptidase n=1 Tax=Niastella vici TaxID=1703345 RepID=UPI0009BDC2BD|nr:M35 family metallo-endopeptidase [Niastella vici]